MAVAVVGWAGGRGEAGGYATSGVFNKSPVLHTEMLESPLTASAF